MPALADAMPENLFRPSPERLAQDLRALTAQVDALMLIVRRLIYGR